MPEREWKTVKIRWSYIFKYSLGHICEMYDYSFIEKKSYLPTNFKY